MSETENIATQLWGHTWPLSHGDVTTEYQLLQEGTSVLALDCLGWLSLSGPDAASFLNGILTPDFRPLKEHEATEAWALDAQGKILFHMYVYRRHAGFFLATAKDQAPLLYTHLNKYLIMEDAQLETTESLCCFTLQGAGAAALLPELNLNEAVEAVPVDRCGLGGYDLLTATENGLLLAARLTEAGIKPVGCQALLMCRTENFMPAFGYDMVVGNNPLLYGKGGSRISYNKGCFLGQETVARTRDRGHPPRLLVLLQSEGEERPSKGEALFFEDKSIGEISSGTHSPKHGAMLAFGLVKYNQAVVDARFSNEGGRIWRVLQISVYRD